jgi:hypothetical protein
MHQQPLVILTYPGHFLLTALTIKSFLLHNSTVSITIVVDDLSRYSWPEYVAECEKFYKTLAKNVSIVTVSQLPEAHDYNQPTNGWLRQQIVKLHLDKLIEHPVWFFTDGDTQFHFPAPVNTVPYTITNCTDDIRPRQNLYVAKMLDISNPGIVTQHPHMDWAPECRAQVCVSNPPFRTMQANTLQKLRQHIQDLRGQNVTQAHTWLYDDMHTAGGDAPFIESEWELIENFRAHVLHEDLNLIYYPTVPWHSLAINKAKNMEFCTTCFASDAQLGRHWFEQQDILISDSVWQRLAQINK